MIQRRGEEALEVVNQIVVRHVVQCRKAKLMCAVSDHMTVLMRLEVRLPRWLETKESIGSATSAIASPHFEGV